MLDVVHFLLEEDTVTITGEQAKARTEFRTRVYGDLYDRTYRFGGKGSGGGGRSSSDRIGGTGTSVVPSDGRTNGGAKGMVHKPYIPPTDTEIGPDPSRPFRGLEAPLG